MRDSLDDIRRDLRLRIADINGRAARLSPLDIHARLDEVRDVAARAGLCAAEGLAERSAQLALLPGCRAARQRSPDDPRRARRPAALTPKRIAAPVH